MEIKRDIHLKFYSSNQQGHPLLFTIYNRHLLRCKRIALGMPKVTFRNVKGHLLRSERCRLETVNKYGVYVTDCKQTSTLRTCS